MEKKADCIKALVFSARSLVRRGIISALSGEDDIKVVGQASNILELMECIYKLNPNIVIVNDDDTTGISSLEAIHLINQKATDIRILLLIKDYNEEKELAALKIGVRGFLPEVAGKDDFIKCIRAINRGEMWVRRKVMEKLIGQLLVLNPPRGKNYLNLSIPSFTKKEMQVMILASKGYRNKEIGRRLFTSEEAVEHCLSKVFKKLNIKKKTEIRRYLNLLL